MRESNHTRLGAVNRQIRDAAIFIVLAQASLRESLASFEQGKGSDSALKDSNDSAFRSRGVPRERAAAPEGAAAR
jgi:hypothetical protein